MEARAFKVSNLFCGKGNLFLGMRFRTKIAESRLDSAESQNLNKNNSVRSTQTRPLRGAKNRNQGYRSATADFLLEADKRGSPPKSEKRQLLARRGSGAGDAALLREKKGESQSKKLIGNSRIAKIDSSLTAFAQNDEFSVDCFGQSPRNDEIKHDSLQGVDSRNDGFFDSTNHTRNNRFILTRSKF